jgi:glutathione S-transferase
VNARRGSTCYRDQQVYMTLTLYQSFRSPNCDRVLIALHEKGLAYRSVMLNLEAKEQKRPEFLRLNPYGRVPVLIDGEVTLYESIIINEYLDTKYPDPPLTHGDPSLIAQGRLLIDYAVNYLHDCYWPLRGEMRKPEEKRDLTVIRHNRRIIVDRLDRLEMALGDKPYFLETFGLTDIGLWPRLSRIEAYGALDGGKLPRLQQWLRRMNARPSVQSILQSSR